MNFLLGKVNQACDYLKNDNELLIKPGIVCIYFSFSNKTFINLGCNISYTL